MEKIFQLLIALSLTTSCYAMESDGHETERFHSYRKALNEAQTPEDFVHFLGKICVDSDRQYDVDKYYDEKAGDFILCDETHPFEIFVEEEDKPKPFIFTFDEGSFAFMITARTADYYGILSDFQDKITESGLVTNCVHVVGPADEDQFPIFKYYFDECKRLGIFVNTLAFDLKNNLKLLECVYNTREKDKPLYNSTPLAIHCIFQSIGLSGNKSKKYIEEFGKRNLIDYIEKLITNNGLSTELNQLSLSKEQNTYSPFEMYSLLKNFVGSYPELLALNDYDTIIPKRVGSFQELQQFSELPEQQKESLNRIISKILNLQDHFEMLKENHQPAHNQLFKDVITSEKRVPLSVLGYMQCRSSFLNKDVHKLLPEIFPDLQEISLYNISDIESFMRFFHEKGTFIKTLERDDENVTGTLDLFDVHMILQRLPISQENAKKLGNSYKMLGEFHMGEKSPIYGMQMNQYMALNLLYQVVKNPGAVSQAELDNKITQLEKILINDDTVILPMSFYTEDQGMHNMSFNTETQKLNLPQHLAKAQQQARERAIEQLLASQSSSYYIYEQGGKAFHGKPSMMIDWFFNH